MFTVEGKNSDGQTALNYAVSLNRLQIVEFLLENGAKINEENKKGYSPLYIAVSKGFKQSVEIMIKHEANIDLEYLLLTATKKGYIDIAKILIANGAKLEEKDAHGGYTPLILATLLGEGLILEILLQNGANIEARDDFGGTVLHNAASLSDCSDKSVEMLIQMGAKIDAKNPNGYTPLHFAALQGWKNSNSMMEIFLKKGANIEAENNFGERAIHIAVNHGHYKTVEIVIKYGTNLDVKSKEQSPIHFALCHRNQDGFPLLEFVSKMNFNFRCKHD